MLRCGNRSAILPQPATTPLRRTPRSARAMIDLGTEDKLATNAAKYGARSVSQAIVEIKWNLS